MNINLTSIVNRVLKCCIFTNKIKNCKKGDIKLKCIFIFEIVTQTMTRTITILIVKCTTTQKFHKGCKGIQELSSYAHSVSPYYHE